MAYQKFFTLDSARSADDRLARLLRVIFYRRGVTTDDFVRYHGEYWVHWGRGTQNENEATHRNNQRRTLLNNKISWKKFWWIVSGLLRLDVVRISITVMENGKEVTYTDMDLNNPDYLHPDPDPSDPPTGPHSLIQAWPSQEDLDQLR